MAPVELVTKLVNDDKAAAITASPLRSPPHRARHEMEIMVEGRKRRTLRDTAFDWSRAIGCTASFAAGSAPR